MDQTPVINSNNSEKESDTNIDIESAVPTPAEEYNPSRIPDDAELEQGSKQTKTDVDSRDDSSNTGSTSLQINTKNLQDSLALSQPAAKKEKSSPLFNITDLTNALKIDPSLLDKLNSPRMMSLDEFKCWMTEGINNVRSHPYKGAPKSVWMWLSDDGFQLRLDPLVYFKLCGGPEPQMFRKDVYEDFVDLRKVWDIRVGRNSSNLKRSKKYVDEDENEEEMYFSLISAERSYDFEVDSPLDFKQIVCGLNKLLETYTRDPPKKSLKLGFTQMHRKKKENITSKIHAFMYNKYMDRFILSCIIFSVLTMAYSGKGADKDALMVLGVLEYVIAVIFTLESALRIIALEGLSPYLSNPWNALDFIIVCLGWFTELPFISGVNFSAFRAFRALRALRTMQYLQGLREVVDTFIGTLEGILQALFVYLYFCWLFAVFGLDVFADAMQFRCVVPQGLGNLPDLSLERPFLNFSFGVPATYCTKETALNANKNSSIADLVCPPSQYCQQVKSMAGGKVGFENLGTSYLTVMRLASKAPGIATIMTPIMESSSDVYIFFFISITVFISALVLALFIAIVRVSFQSTQRKKWQENENRKIVEKKASVQPSESEPAEKRQSENLAENFSFSRKKVLPEETSMVVSKKLKKERVCCCLPAEGCFVERIRWFILHPLTDRFVMIAIVVNCIFLAMEKHPMEPWYSTMLKIVEVAFTFLFLGEMILKIIGLKGIAQYLYYDINQKWNCFDAFIVMITIFDFLMTEYANGFVNISFLRVFRVGRLLRMLRSNKELMKIIEAIVNSLPAMGNVLLFMTLIIILFAILGMQLFGGEFPTEEVWIQGKLTTVTIRSNFDDFMTSMLTLFKVLTGGAGTWSLIYDAMNTTSGGFAPFFFVIYSVMVSYILLNVLIVILMSQFAPTETERNEMRDARTALMRRRASQKFDYHGQLNEGLGTTNRRQNAIQGGSRRGKTLGWRKYIVPKLLSAEKLNYSFCMPTNHPVRVKLKRFTEHPVFEGVIIATIVLSSLFLALESPTYSNADLTQVMFVADLIFMIIFVLEMVLKIIANGFILPQKSYLSNAWNRLDFFVIIVSFAGYGGGGSSIGRTLRVGRILRPLRMINRNEGLKVIVDALLRSMTPVFYTVVILLAYFFLFGVLGVSLFSGRFYACNDKSVVGKSTCVGVFLQNGIVTPRVWQNPPYNFDNIFNAIRTLFEVVALRGWLGPLHSAIDAVGIDQQPIYNNSPGAAIYFVFYIFIGANFFLKIFVGIIVGTFRKFSGTLLYTDAQLKWLVTKQMIATVKPKFRRPRNEIQGYAHDVVTNRSFEDLMTMCILLQLIILGTKNVAVEDKSTVSIVMHWVFTGIYSIETLLRFLAFGLRRFVGKFWNIWDAFIIILMIALPLSQGIYNGVGVLRAFQFSRITVLLRRFTGIERLFGVLVKSVPPMLNVTGLFMLLLYVFAILGMSLFALVKKGPNLDNLADFSTFPASVITLYKIVAGENWMGIMRDVSIPSSMCTNNYPVPSETWYGNKDCGESDLAPIFFFAFFILVFCVFLNLYVATILDTFSAVTTAGNIVSAGKGGKHQKEIGISYEDFAFYRDVWHRYDPDSSGSIAYDEIKPFVKSLHEIKSCSLGFDPDTQKSSTMKIFAKIDLELDLAASRTSFNVEVPRSPPRSPSNREKHNSFADRPNARNVSFAMLLETLCSRSVPIDALGAEEYVKLQLRGRRVLRVISAMKIQHAVRDWLKRKQATMSGFGIHDTTERDQILP